MRLQTVSSKMREEEIKINKIAQGKIGFEEGVSWFDTLGKERQKEVLKMLILFTRQVHPTKELVEIALQAAPIENTMTPVVIFKTKDPATALNKMMTLPEGEWKKAFVTVLSVFKAADANRRKIWCKNGCTHEWHNLE